MHQISITSRLNSPRGVIYSAWLFLSLFEHIGEQLRAAQLSSRPAPRCRAINHNRGTTWENNIGRGGLSKGVRSASPYHLLNHLLPEDRIYNPTHPSRLKSPGEGLTIFFAHSIGHASPLDTRSCRDLWGESACTYFVRNQIYLASTQRHKKSDERHKGLPDKLQDYCCLIFRTESNVLNAPYAPCIAQTPSARRQ